MSHDLNLSDPTHSFDEKKHYNKVTFQQGKPILDVVNIGIGGSHLGSKTAESALKYYCDGPDIHFASSVDPSSMSDILNKCQPKKTIFIINSKSFKTTEVLNNAKLAKQWLKNNNQRYGQKRPINISIFTNSII